MESNIEEYAYNTKNMRNVLLGLLFGGLIGAIAMLLFAPQSGKRARTQIYQEGIELRDRTTTGINEAAEQVRSLTNRITAEAQKKAGKLKQLGQDQLVEQMDDVSAAVEAA
jgi:gas vesicle protein